MNRKAKVLRHIDRSGRGIEVGPCHNPIAPKREGFRVEIIDHMSREGLREKYRTHGIDIDQIEDVDFVWRGERYADLTGKCGYYDWIIASHVIEHAPDLIGFLNDCAAILKEDGIVSLVVPDKRYCFDHYRPLTGLARVIDSHLTAAERHSPGTVAEYFMNVVAKDGAIAWSAETPGKLSFVHSVDDAISRMHDVRNNGSYYDVHAWCFVPHSFRLLIHDLHALGLIPFQEVDFLPTAGCEFYVTLSRAGKGVGQSRLELLEIIEAENAEVRVKRGGGMTRRGVRGVFHRLAKRLICP